MRPSGMGYSSPSSTTPLYNTTLCPSEDIHQHSAFRALHPPTTPPSTRTLLAFSAVYRYVRCLLIVPFVVVWYRPTVMLLLLCVASAASDACERLFAWCCLRVSVVSARCSLRRSLLFRCVVSSRAAV